MRVLVTNDDGINAPGLHALARALSDDGHDILVAAPQDDVSGTSAAIGLMREDRTVEVAEMSLLDLPEVTGFAVAGSPGLAVLVASLGAFGPRPDLVASGINAGLNTGYSVLHSGTVGAALTAQNLGISALAVSLGPAEPWPWDTACAYLRPVFTWLERAPRGSVVNLNVPGLPFDESFGLRRAALDRFGTVRAAVGASQGGNIQFEFRETDASPEPGTDTALVEAGYATYTSIVGIAETPLHITRADAPRLASRAPRSLLRPRRRTRDAPR